MKKKCFLKAFRLLTEQYELAGKPGQMVMFVGDNEAKKLVSSLLDYK